MPITTQPSAGKPAGASGDFQNGLFGCACGSCIKALCCPCLIAKDVANEVGDSGTLWCLGYLAGIFTGYLVSSSNPKTYSLKLHLTSKLWERLTASGIKS